MEESLARVLVGLPVAALWPLTVPYLSASWVRSCLVAGISAAYVLAPLLPDGSAWLLLAATPAFTLLLTAPAGTDDPTPQKRPDGKRALWVFAGMLLLAAATIALLDLGEVVDSLRETLDDDSVAFVATGFFTCVFLGGSAVAWLLAPFARTLDEREETSSLPSLRHAGRYIGWFERGLLFTLVLGGAPEAAALALAAKSFARFPSLQAQQEGFAEYFLIGSLSSIAVALTAAVATRAAIGATPVL